MPEVFVNYMKFTKAVRKFLEEPNFMVLGTLRKDGSMQMTIVWYEFDGKVFRISTTSSRVKYRNLLNDPRVTFVIYDRDNQYRYVQIRGKVKSHTKKGGHDFIDKLSWKYFKKKIYPNDPDRKEDRVTFTLTPESVSSMGID